MHAEYVCSQRNGRLLQYSGYLYRYVRKSADGLSVYFRCRKGCSATATVVDNVVVQTRGTHRPSHLFDTHVIQRKEQLAVLRKKVKEDATGYQTIPNIFRNVLKETNLTHENAGLIPTFPSSNSIMYRERSYKYGALPKTLGEIELPDFLKQTISSNENFLMADDGMNENRMMIFSTKTNLSYLCKSTAIYGDGTFKVAPNLFYQLYSLHATVYGENVPLVYVLLPNKTKDTYVRMFTIIKNCCAAFGLTFNPRQFRADFEIGVLQSFFDVFTGSEIKCCSFHFGQSLWRKVQDLGLSVEVKQKDSEVQRAFRRCCGLSHVPEDQVGEAFTFIVEESPMNEKLFKFFDYILENYIGDTSAPRFPISWWNHFSDQENRTDNAQEDGIQNLEN